MSTLNTTKLVIATSIAALLAACGGGATPKETSFPVQQALTTVYTNGLSKTLNVTGNETNGGVDYPLTGTLTFTVGAGTSATFNGATAIASVNSLSGNVFINGQTRPMNSSGTSYLTPSYQLFGQSSTGNYCIVTTPGAFPSTAIAGLTGDVATYTCYRDSTKTTITNTQKISYTTTANSNGMLNFQVITSNYSTTNVLTGKSSITLGITTNGIGTLIQYDVNVTSSGFTSNLVAQ